VKISTVLGFLEKIKESEGDLEVQSITGFWVRDIPSTGERVVVPAVGDGKSIEDVLRKVAVVEPFCG
jgi:uncharacterized protein (DUF849 family)